MHYAQQLNIIIRTPLFVLGLIPNNFKKSNQKQNINITFTYDETSSFMVVHIYF